jgi:hypothetical protein
LAAKTEQEELHDKHESILNEISSSPNVADLKLKNYSSVNDSGFLVLFIYLLLMNVEILVPEDPYDHNDAEMEREWKKEFYHVNLKIRRFSLFIYFFFFFF